MPHIYITDEAKKTLDVLSDSEHRTISREIEFLLDKRVKELGLHDVNTLSSSDDNKPTNSGGVCQVQNGENNA